MMAKYDWIATDRCYFGQPNTAYDFVASGDPREVSRKVARLQEQKVYCITGNQNVLLANLIFGNLYA